MEITLTKSERLQRLRAVNAAIEVLRAVAFGQPVNRKALVGFDLKEAFTTLKEMDVELQKGVP